MHSAGISSSGSPIPTLLERVPIRGASPGTIQAACPALRAIADAAQTSEGLGTLASRLASIDPAEAETLLHVALAQAAADGRTRNGAMVNSSLARAPRSMISSRSLRPSMTAAPSTSSRQWRMVRYGRLQIRPDADADLVADLVADHLAGQPAADGLGAGELAAGAADPAAGGAVTVADPEQPRHPQHLKTAAPAAPLDLRRTRQNPTTVPPEPVRSTPDLAYGLSP